MKKQAPLPPELIDGGSLPETHGREDGDWYYEEDQGSSRMGIKI